MSKPLSELRVKWGLHQQALDRIIDLEARCTQLQQDKAAAPCTEAEVQAQQAQEAAAWEIHDLGLAQGKALATEALTARIAQLPRYQATFTTNVDRRGITQSREAAIRWADLQAILAPPQDQGDGS